MITSKNPLLHLLFMASIIVLCSCCAPKLIVKGVGYQSVEQKSPSSNNIDKANIVAKYFIDADGNISILVENHTDKIMTIDRTKSFFQNDGEQAQMYYDSRVVTNTSSTTVSSSSGAAVNLGAIAGAVGIGGILGRALSGVNVGGSSGEAVTNSQTSYTIDQPKMSIPPHGSMYMGRTFKINGLGYDFLKQAINSSNQDVGKAFESNTSYAGCHVCISYSVDDEKTFDLLEIKLYANSILISKVRQQGNVNDAVRRLLLSKDNLLTEQWYILCAPFNIKNIKYDKSDKKQDYIISKHYFINYK